MDARDSGFRDDDDADGEAALTRRTLLGSLAAAGAAGCLSESANSSTPTSETGAVETSTPTPTESGWGDIGGTYYRGLVADFRGMGLPTGEFVYGNSEVDAMGSFTLASDVASGEALSVGDAHTFSIARRVEVPTATENPWDVNFYGQVDGRSVGAGDALLGVFYLRGPESSQTRPRARFSAKVDGHLDTNLVRSEPTAHPPAEWTRYYVPIEVKFDAEPGSWWTELWLGYGPQTVDVGGAALVDFGDRVDVGDLPSGPVGVTSATATATADPTATTATRRTGTATSTTTQTGTDTTTRSATTTETRTGTDAE